MSLYVHILEGFLIWLSIVKDRLKMYWPQIRLPCAKRKRKWVKFVTPPKEMLLLFSCVRFLTNYDLRKRKQHIVLTISFVLKQKFWAGIKSHETTIDPINVISRFSQSLAVYWFGFSSNKAFIKNNLDVLNSSQRGLKMDSQYRVPMLIAPSNPIKFAFKSQVNSQKNYLKCIFLSNIVFSLIFSMLMTNTATRLIGF